MKLWMVIRYLGSGKKYLSSTFLLAVFGVALGVASLVIAMAVVSGYESTLRQSVINVQGHLAITQQGGVDSEVLEFEKTIRSKLPDLVALSPFVHIEGLIVHEGKLSGVAVEGVDESNFTQVMGIQDSLVSGAVELDPVDGLPAAFIGKGVAKKFNLKVGDDFKLVIPITSAHAARGFRPKVQIFRVSGIMNLGRTDYDERFIISSLKEVQKFGELGQKISGWRAKLSRYDLAASSARVLEKELPSSFWIKPWSQVNKNLFQAVKYEKAVIFLIVLLMVVAAAFNVASTLYLSVLRRYSQISILRAIGVTRRFVSSLFELQGLAIGFLGSIIGVGMGWGGCRLFLWAEKAWGIFPGEVYKLDYVKLEMRWQDLIIILISTMVICYLATIAPAYKGARLNPVEGLRYE